MKSSWFQVGVQEPSRFERQCQERVDEEENGFSAASSSSSPSIVRRQTLIGTTTAATITTIVLVLFLGVSLATASPAAAWMAPSPTTATTSSRRRGDGPRFITARTTTSWDAQHHRRGKPPFPFHSASSTRQWAIHLPDSKSSSTSASSMESDHEDDEDEEEYETVVENKDLSLEKGNTDDMTTKTDAVAAPASIDILLNLNAKGVTPSVVQVIESVVANYQESSSSSTTASTIRIHTTRTKDQAMQAVKDIVQAKSTLVIPIGGDGTLTALLQLLAEQLGPEDECNNDPTTSTNSAVSPPPLLPTTTPRQLPDIAYIPMGTGNALGSVVGCRPPKTTGRFRQWMKTLRRRPSFLGGTSRKLQTLSETMTTLLELAETLPPQRPDDNNNDDNKCSTMVDIVELPLLQVTTKIQSDTTTTTTTSSSNTKEDTDQQDLPQDSSLCFFAGVGFDSLMLQDYHDLQDWTSSLDKPHRRLFKESLSSVLGYCVALVTRTLPQCLLDQKHLIQVEVSTRQPASTVWIDHRRGDVVRPVETSPTTTTSPSSTTSNTLLYRGTAGIVAVGSAPFYGGGLRLFPFARMTTGGMQLRIGRIHPLRGTMNIPKIFEGSYRDTRDDAFGCLDFMGSQFSIKILSPSQGYPVQHSGDFIGTTTEVDFAMVPHLLQPIRFVTLLPPRLILE